MLLADIRKSVNSVVDGGFIAGGRNIISHLVTQLMLGFGGRRCNIAPVFCLHRDGFIHILLPREIIPLRLSLTIATIIFPPDCGLHTAATRKFLPPRWKPITSFHWNIPPRWGFGELATVRFLPPDWSLTDCDWLYSTQGSSNICRLEIIPPRWDTIIATNNLFHRDGAYTMASGFLPHVDGSSNGGPLELFQPQWDIFTIATNNLFHPTAMGASTDCLAISSTAMEQARSPRRLSTRQVAATARQSLQFCWRAAARQSTSRRLLYGLIRKTLDLYSTGNDHFSSPRVRRSAINPNDPTTPR